MIKNNSCTMFDVMFVRAMEKSLRYLAEVPPRTASYSASQLMCGFETQLQSKCFYLKLSVYVSMPGFEPDLLGKV